MKMVLDVLEANFYLKLCHKQYLVLIVLICYHHFL